MCGNGDIMVKKWNVFFPSPQGKDKRRVYLYLPESYSHDKRRRYPVLYMFDGHNVFFDEDATYGKCWGMKEYMDFTETQMIIVALECSHHPDNGRLMEYSPFDFSERSVGDIHGYGKETMDWIVGTLKRNIDKRYRTLSDREHTYIAGSSMGGLMSLYALLKYNHVFSKAAALSPSVWTSPADIEQLIKESKTAAGTALYMDYGSNEMKNHKAMRRQFEKVSRQLYNKNIFLTSRIVPYGDHCEACWEKQIPFFMQVLEYEGYR